MKKLIAFALGALAPVLTGCVSTKYKMAKAKITPPAVTLNLSNVPAPSPAAHPELEVTVHSVIVFQGPGSWKRAAYWDEYIVTVANRGGRPVTVQNVTLTDFENQPVTPGENPWALEKLSHHYAARVGERVGDVLKVGGATVLTSTAAGGVAVIGAMNVGSQLGAAMVVGGTVMFAAATVVVPVWSVVANVNSRHEIEAEYRRRRLGLPMFLAPGQLTQGSFFFRISPGPQRLTLHCLVDHEPRNAVVDLASLAGLHFKNPPLSPAR
jgi:hypothetical protein